MPKYVVRVRQTEVWKLIFEAGSAGEARRRVREFWDGHRDELSDPAVGKAIEDADVDSDSGEILEVRKYWDGKGG